MRRTTKLPDDSHIEELKGVQKKPNKSFVLFLCLNPRFWGRKLVLVGKIHFPSLFILWSKVEKRMENTKNDVLKKMSLFCVTKKTAPPILLNLSGYKYARRLGHISYERCDP